MVPTVFCKHLDENGDEVGLPIQHFKNIINEKTSYKTGIISYERKVNYESLASRFDHLIVFIFNDSFYNSKKYFLKQLQMIQKIPNVTVIESSIAEYRDLYKHYKGHTVNMKYRILLEKAHEIINKTTNYDITVFKRIDEFYDGSTIYSFNYKNLKNYLIQN